jgi:hypothetical protein
VTEENVKLAMERFSKQIPAENQGYFLTLLKEASDDAYEQIMTMPMKMKGTTLLLSIFLGGVGADRFYLNSSSLGVENGDRTLGGFKLGGTAVVCVSSLIYYLAAKGGAPTGFLLFVSMFLGALRYLWNFIDYFLTYKKAKLINYEKAIGILKKNIPEDAKVK